MSLTVNCSTSPHSMKLTCTLPVIFQLVAYKDPLKIGMESSLSEHTTNNESEKPAQNKQAHDTQTSPSEELIYDDVFCDPPIYYFGYGAMANSISRKRRGVISRYESAAVLSNYSLIFAGGGGATVSPCPGESVHGIVMELTQKGWEFMTTFEKGYNVIEETVIPYKNGGGSSCEEQQPIQARLFRMPLDMETDISKRSIPTERYLKVIVAGMKEYGVQDDYIQKQLLNIEFVPSTKPEAYRSFQPDKSSSSWNNLQTLSWSKYQDLCKDKQCFMIGKRIICFQEFVDHPFARWMAANILGRDDCVWTVWNMFLDLSIPSCDCKEELKDVHARWAENHLLELLEKCNISPPVVCGLLE